jgi:hypothetical protein
VSLGALLAYRLLQPFMTRARGKTNFSAPPCSQVNESELILSVLCVQTSTNARPESRLGVVCGTYG